MPDHGLARVVGIVLVEQEVDHGLPKGAVVRGRIVALQRRWIHAKGMFRDAWIPVVHKAPPGPHEVLLENQAVEPAFDGVGFVPRQAVALAVDDRARQDLA